MDRTRSVEEMARAADEAISVLETLSLSPTLNMVGKTSTQQSTAVTDGKDDEDEDENEDDDDEDEDEDDDDEVEAVATTVNAPEPTQGRGNAHQITRHRQQRRMSLTK